MKLLDYFIRVRVCEDDRKYIEKFAFDNDISISELFRNLIKQMRSASL